MTYKFETHTADIRLRVEAKTLEELFRDALNGMMEFIKPEGFIESKKPNVRKILIDSYDQTTLLIDFLSDVLLNAHTHKEIYTSLKILKLTQNHFEAVIKGSKINEFSEDIKAVTYHEADVKKNDKGNWETVIIFDI